MMKDTLRYMIWALCVSLWATICFVAPDFIDTPVDGLLGWLQVTVFVVACGIGAFFWIYIMGCSRIVCAVLLPLFSIVGSALAFYRIGYRTTLTPMLLEVMLNTNTEEALGVISWQMILWVLLNLCIAIGMVWIRWNKIRLPHAWVHLLVAIVLSFGFYHGHKRLHRGLSQRYPHNVPTTIIDYCSLQKSIQEQRTIPMYHVEGQPDSLHIVFIIGEAVRADHLQLNGYARQTTPRLAQRKNIVSYPYIYSEQTHTLACLPYLLTRADSVHEEYQYSETSFIRIFREQGYKTACLSNQEMGSSYSPLFAECDTVIYPNAGKSVYVFSPWLDEELIAIMDRLNETQPARSLYVLHTIGSHWYYDNHVPEHMYYYQPRTSNKVITSNSIEQIVNSYDNTVCYMDVLVDSIISTLEDQNALVIYQSDHGEALGEDGYYLHANDAEAVKNPACVIWYSDTYASMYPDKIKALVANKDKRYRTDYLFYSILYAAGIEAEGDNTAVNIFKQRNE